LCTTNDDALAAAVRSLRNHGATGAPPADLEPSGPWTMATFDRIGFNLRLSDIQAAVGIAQMAKLDALLAERRACAERYHALLGDVADLALPLPSDNAAGHTYQSYVVRLREGGRARRNRIMAALAAKDIETRPGTHAVHRLGYYREKYRLRPEQFPVAAASEDTTITLPLFPGMTDTDQQAVVDALRKALKA
jgi:dTDP-4-amino-4,6-dideoxygalactose transaminase